MINALSTAATGLEAQTANIERISNDIANANTDGYKRSRIDFEDLMYQTIKEPGGELGQSTQSPVGIQQGKGVRVGAAHKLFEPGPARMTSHPFDLMIEGTGFFPVSKPNGQIAYSRVGAFKLDAQGKMMTGAGASLIPQITVPPNAASVMFKPNGEVVMTTPEGGETTLGQIQLVTFQNPEGLSAMGNGLYGPTAASGGPLQGVPGENGMGTILQGALEGSNVNVANSMVDMITTQRAYEMNAKVMSIADQMLSATVNVK